MKKYIAEFIGTLTLVLFGCGIAVVSGGNLVATSLAFGLAIVALAYVIGPVSGCHVNPAITLSMLIDKRISLKDAILYLPRNDTKVFKSYIKNTSKLFNGKTLL